MDFSRATLSELAAHADVFRLGVLLWRVVTGFPVPFGDLDHLHLDSESGPAGELESGGWADTEEVNHAEFRTDLPVFASGPRLLPALLQGCLHPDPFQRPSAQAVLMAFDHMMHDFDMSWSDSETSRITSSHLPAKLGDSISFSTTSYMSPSLSEALGQHHPHSRSVLDNSMYESDMSSELGTNQEQVNANGVVAKLLAGIGVSQSRLNTDQSELESDLPSNEPSLA